MIASLHTPSSTLLLKFPTDSTIPNFSEKSSAKKLIVRAIAKLIATGSAQILYTGNNPEDFFSVDSAEANDNGIVVQIQVIGDNSLGFNLPPFAMLKKFKQALMNNTEHIVIEKMNATASGVRFIEIYTKVGHLQPRKVSGFQYQQTTRFEYSQA